MTNALRFPAADPHAAAAHFTAELAFEADPDDVHRDMTDGNTQGYVLVETRAPEAFAQARIPGAINLPHRTITAERMTEWPQDTLFVVYCAGPHCNGADRAAILLAELGRPVKIMIGGLTGWLDEGFTLERS